jgi:hypothetical protein
MNKQQFVMITMVLNGKTLFYFILTSFVYGSTPFLAHWIVTTPKTPKLVNKS